MAVKFIILWNDGKIHKEKVKALVLARVITDTEVVNSIGMEAGSYYCIITIAFNSITESKLKIYDNGVYFTSTLKDKNNSPAYKAFIIAAGTKAIGNPCFTFMEDSSFFYSIYIIIDYLNLRYKIHL